MSDSNLCYWIICQFSGLTPIGDLEGISLVIGRMASGHIVSGHPFDLGIRTLLCNHFSLCVILVLLFSESTAIAVTTNVIYYLFHATSITFGIFTVKLKT